MTMRSVTPLEAEGADFVVCVRVADLGPISGYPKHVQELVREVRNRSERMACQGCGEPVLVDVTVVPVAPPKVCTHCMASIKDMADRAAKPS